MVKLFANSGDPYQMPHSAASDLGLRCLPFTFLGASRLQWVKMSSPLLIVSQSHNLIQIVDINSHTDWKTVQIWIFTVCKGRACLGWTGPGFRWLHTLSREAASVKKPTDLDLHCLQRQGMSGFNRTGVHTCIIAYFFKGGNYSYFSFWKGNRFFLFKVDIFSEGAFCIRMQTGTMKVVSLVKRENLPSVSMFLTLVLAE